MENFNSSNYSNNNLNKQPTWKCEISCKNNGICIDSNTCLCHPDYNGPHCELKKNSCMTYPPLPMNSRRRCSSEMCTISCMEGYKFIDGSSVAIIKCVNGVWQPTRADLTSTPECKPVCNPPCQNQGTCLGGNTCQCPADYRGPQCQYRKCEISCKNNGICIDTNTCLCHPDYNGPHCELKKNSCMTYPPLVVNSRRQCSSEMCTISCMEGYKFIDGSSVAIIKCVNGVWQPTRADLTSTPECKPVCNPPCQNQGTCLGGNTCQCPADYRGPQCQYRKCEISCKNNGICIDTNTCLCHPDYNGPHCELKKKSCMTYPPLVVNSRRQCSSEMCTISCMKGYKFIDGSSVANIKCVNGVWQPTRADLTSTPECKPVCNPPCQNQGTCLGGNTCQCPADYRGPQCQYPSNVCDVRKLAFNGGYSCYGDAEKFSCRLTCPAGSSYSTPPADIYTCLYSMGTFEPQPIPHCLN